MITGKVFEIKRFAVHDGDGIRTTVFLKGCPLKCVWCHNPEGISFDSQLACYDNKCIRCGECISICKINAHSITGGKHIYDDSKCIKCGECEKGCLGEALKFYGNNMTVEQVMEILVEDKAFYENSGGGVTLSGGECLCQAEFCTELLKQLKNSGINTAVDTCGFVSRETIEKVMPYTDVFLYDIKAFDEEVHIKCTGQSNKVIFENLKYLDAGNKEIEIRIPFVPDYNDNQIEKILDYLSAFKNIRKVKILPYHNYAGSKYEALCMKNTLPDKLPEKSTIEKIIQKYRNTQLKII